MRAHVTGRSLLAWPIALFLGGCALATYPIRPGVPERLAEVPPPAVPVTESVINFPVRADLSGLLDTVNDERTIPKTFDQWGASLKTIKGVEYKYYAEREAFSMNSAMAGYSSGAPDAAPLRDWWKGVEASANISVQAPIHYKIAAMPRAGLTGDPAQCGDGGDSLRRGSLSGAITLDMTPNYGVSGSVTEAGVYAVDPCKVGIAGIDVAKEVYNSLSDILRGGLQQSLVRITGMTFRPQVDEVWNALRKPLPLKPDAWLLFNVTKLGHSGFSAAGRSVNDTIRLTAKPVVAWGDEPPAATSSLPPLDTSPPADGFRMVTEVQLDYAALSEMLAERLKGNRIAHNDNAIVVTDASIYGNGGNRVVIRLDFRGDARGHVYLIGKPQLNMLTQTLYFDSLRYDIETGQMLEKSAEWLARSTFREVISTEAVVGVSSLVKQAQDLLTPAMNYRLNQALLLQGKLASVQAIGVFADAKGLHIQVMAEGTLNVKALGGS
jgi:hypothetical protein